MRLLLPWIWTNLWGRVPQHFSPAKTTLSASLFLRANASRTETSRTPGEISRVSFLNGAYFWTHRFVSRASSQTEIVRVEMQKRAIAVFAVGILLSVAGFAKDKKKNILPAYV